MRDTGDLNDLTIVVERKGFGRQAWHWRLSNGMRDQAASTCGVSSAEEAYVTGKAHLLQHRADQAYMRSMTRLRFACEVDGPGYV